MSNNTSTEPMESHGLRLPPNLWRAIERRSGGGHGDRSKWIRLQLEALVGREPDVPESHANVSDHHDGKGINWRNADA